MALKYFLIAALSMVALVIGWAVTAAVLLYHGYPRLADAMNDVLTLAIIWWLYRTEGREPRKPE